MVKNFDQILKDVRAGKEFFLDFNDIASNGKIQKRISMADVFAVAKSRNRKMNPIAPNQADYVNWVLYDEISFAAAATIPQLSKLFVVPIGGTKTKVQTNLELVSQLPAPQWMNVTGFAIYIRPNVAPVDLDGYLNTTYQEFWVSNKVYLEGRLDCFPNGGGPTGPAVSNANTATTGTSLISNGWQTPSSIYDVRLPAGLALGKDGNGMPVVSDGLIGITILQSQTFHVELKCDGGGITLAAANATPFNGTGLTVGARLHGILSRGVQ